MAIVLLQISLLEDLLSKSSYQAVMGTCTCSMFHKCYLTWTYQLLIRVVPSTSS